jgi:hypothetical protein
MKNELSLLDLKDSSGSKLNSFMTLFIAMSGLCNGGGGGGQWQ